MNFKRILSVILSMCFFINVLPAVSEAASYTDLLSGYNYRYTYADINFDKKDTWNDTVNFNQLGYGLGTGSIDISASGIGNNGKSAKISTCGKVGVSPDAIKVSFDFLCVEFTNDEISCDLKFGSSWYSGLHIKKDNERSGYGIITLWGTALASVKCDTWHNISYIINSKTSKYTLYIDGAEKNTLDFLGAPHSVQIATGSNTMYIDNACIQIVNPSDYSFVRSVNNQTFESASVDSLGWIDTAIQKISGSAEFTDYKYCGSIGKSMKLYNSSDFRFYTENHYVSQDSFGETTQINNIRADISSGIAVYSADFLFSDFLTVKSFQLNSLLTSGTYSWMLGGFVIPATGTSVSNFVTTGLSTGAKSKSITVNTWYNVTLVVDLDSSKMYYYIDNQLIDSKRFSGVKMLYRVSAESKATDYSTMYLDNVNITAYSKTDNTPSVFESDDDLKTGLMGYGAIHVNSGCIVRPDGVKLLSDYVVLKSEKGIMVDSSAIYALLGSLPIGVQTEVHNGIVFYNLEDCISKSGKTFVYSDSAKNGGFYIVGNYEYPLPSGESLQKLNDYIFYLRPDSQKVSKMYNSSKIKGSHPRLLFDNEEFENLRTLVDKNSSDMQSVAYKLMDYADWIVNHTNIITYSKNYGDELRMNNRASEFDVYMYSLAVAWQVARTLNPQKAGIYKQYAWKNIKSVASFPDWNPAHHIDHGIFASGFAIAYDMMYEAWSDEQRKIMEDAALKNGLEWYKKSYEITYSAMTNAAYVENNHNAMTNGNAVLLSLAFMDVYPEDCAYVLSNALRGMENMLINFAPEGAWWEGVFYSALNMTYLCPAYEALKNVFGSCLRLDTVQGYDGAGDFIEVAQSDVGIYNFADADFTKCTPDIWYQTHFGRDWSSLFMRLANGTLSADGKTLAVALMANTKSVGTSSKLPFDKYFENTQLIAMHDSYDEGQTFVGIKAGETVYAHSHFDAGSFVYDYNGVRWAHDMGKDDYNLPGFWDTDGGRWKVFLNRAESHNTIIVDPDMNPDYKIGSYAPVTHYETNGDGAIVKIDTSRLYEGRLSDAKRAFCFTDSRKSLVIRDELVTLPEKSSVIYSMLYTKALPSVDKANKRVILTDTVDKTKKVAVEFLCSQGFDIVTELAKPLPGTSVVDGQKNNSGFYRVALKTTASGKVNITVKITPLGIESTDISSYNIPIDDWDENVIRSDFERILLNHSKNDGRAYAIFAEYSSKGKMLASYKKELSASDMVVSIKNPYALSDNGYTKFFVLSKKNLRPLRKVIEQ